MFMIAGVDNGRPWRFDAITGGAVRMMKRKGAYYEVADAAYHGDLLIFKVLGHRDGIIRRLHLRGKETLQFSRVDAGINRRVPDRSE